MYTSVPKTNVGQPNLRLELVQEIQAAARAMFPGGATISDGKLSAANLSSLRQLQQWCDRALPLASNRTDCFLLFFLSSFIGDIFFNLTGDIPYDEEIEKNKRAFYRMLAKWLKGLASSLSLGKRDKWIVACEVLVESYFLTINSLNEIG